MTTVQVTLPDELAVEAKEAGLLSDGRLEGWLREQVRQQRIAELFAAMDRMAACNELPEMSPEEISEEIHAMRAERRASQKCA